MPCGREAGGERDGVLLGDADIEDAVGMLLVHRRQAGALEHRGGDGDDPRVALDQLLGRPAAKTWLYVGERARRAGSAAFFSQ